MQHHHPSLEWDGPDDDGDHIVVLNGVPGWHLAAHGPTQKMALMHLADAITIVGELEMENRPDGDSR